MSESSSANGRFLVVGDVHGMWDDVDHRFVEAGSQDTVVFVGDFGEEDVALVTRVARLACHKVVILGNHDGWWAMRRGGGPERVDAQLAELGDAHIGYRAVQVPAAGYALLGARPFSWGGGWKTMRAFYERLYGVRTNDESAERIVRAAEDVPGVALILVGHNGPKGLGQGRDAIYGCDFRKPHIDFGDPDQLLALDLLRNGAGRKVIATVAGHMHDRLQGGGDRRRVVSENGTIHLNAAVVPRHVSRAGGRQRHFMEVVVEGETLARADDIWVDDRGEVVDRHQVFARQK